MALIPYINFNGNCREAIVFYQKVFDTESEDLMTYGEMPPDPSFPVTDDIKDLVANASLGIGKGRVMFSDVPPGMKFTQGNHMSILITGKDKKKLKTYFNRLKEEGEIDMELQETFWSKLYGSLHDKFGIGWQVNLDSEE